MFRRVPPLPETQVTTASGSIFSDTSGGQRVDLSFSGSAGAAAGGVVADRGRYGCQAAVQHKYLRLLSANILFVTVGL